MSSGSKEDDERKRQREESPHISCLDSPTSPGNVFAERLKSNECVEISMNCLKNLEKEVKEYKDLASSNNANQRTPFLQETHLGDCFCAFYKSYQFYLLAPPDYWHFHMTMFRAAVLKNGWWVLWILFPLPSIAWH